MNEIAASLRQYVDENFLFGVSTDYSNDDSFLDHGIVDSTGVLELIAHLEGEYQIQIDDEDLIPENLDSISGLVQFIDRKRNDAVSNAI
jgi:acyl carrier protein